MLKSPLLTTISVLVTLLSWTSSARAKDSLVLSFALPKPHAKSSASIAQTQTNAAAPADIGLSFGEDMLTLPVESGESQTANSQTTDDQKIDINSEQIEETHTQYQTLGLDDWIFEGGSRSLVAHTVGSAEGTRHWNGRRTKAYYGHTDPGNGVWNLGTFSYQHEARSPEEADDKQLKRLKVQGTELEHQATAHGIRLSLQEKLNGLDLANQAPLAALGEGGYISRLAQAQRLRMSEKEAIAWARTWSYLDPKTKSWNAPGLGNNVHSISQDQERRMVAIDKALRAYEQTDHVALELAKLDSIHLEGSELDGIGLSRPVADAPSLGSVAEEFKQAAREVTATEVPTNNALDRAIVEFKLSEKPQEDREEIEVDAVHEIEKTSTADLLSETSITETDETTTSPLEAIAAETNSRASKLSSADAEQTYEVVTFALPSHNPMQTAKSPESLSSLLNRSPHNETSNETPNETSEEIVSTNAAPTDSADKEARNLAVAEEVSIEAPELTEQIVEFETSGEDTELKNAAVEESAAIAEKFDTADDQPELASLLNGIPQANKRQSAELSSLADGLEDTQPSTVSSMLTVEDRVVQPPNQSSQ